MTTPSAIQGTFADLKTVKTRSVVQMIIEVPIEQGKQVVDAFGFPQPGSEIPVAVARINPSQCKPVQASTSQRKPAATLAEKMRRLCGVEAFQHFMQSKSDGGWDASVPVTNKYERTSARVKHFCMIKSKAELDTNPEAAKRCNTLLAEYEQSVGRMATRTS